jgi:hypothetical protein
MIKISTFFIQPASVTHKQYEALRMYFVEGKNAKEVADKFGYKYRAFTSLVTDFMKDIEQNKVSERFFVYKHPGRHRNEQENKIKEFAVKLRKKNFSIEDIKISLDAAGYQVSENTIYLLLKYEGFAKLPKRSKDQKKQLENIKIEAQKTSVLSFEQENFKTSSGGLLCLLPYIQKYGIDKIISKSSFPETKTMPRLQSILSFLALKLSSFRRYSSDDMWCMDRGTGLFAGLNVLPKTTWFSSYSDRVTKNMNTNFLKQLHKVWFEVGLLGDTVNLDFTTVPYWGEDSHLENNWSGKRNKALASMLSVLAHDPDTGIIDYGRADVKHNDENKIVLEFLDFYKHVDNKTNKLNYLVFDSKFTNYENLSKIDDNDVKFITIRRRGKNIVEEINKIQKSDWKTIRVEKSGNKKRSIKIHEKTVFLKGYNKEIRQIYITGNGKIKPAIIITNDFDISTNELVRKYAKRWLVEKVISEQIEFFHLNKVSSSMVIKVDFDLTMSILAHNIYRLFALEMEGYSHLTSQSLYEKFISNSADVQIEKNQIQINLKKKRNLPLILEKMELYKNNEFSWLGNNKINFKGASYT